MLGEGGDLLSRSSPPTDGRSPGSFSLRSESNWGRAFGPTLVWRVAPIRQGVVLVSDSAPGEPDGALFERRLEQLKLEALADFAAGAGHEMNNPLAVIAGRAQLLLGDETDPERRAALALIWAQAQRVHEMIADAMLFARPPAPQFEQIEWEIGRAHV